ncbi:MAG: methyltransferase [Herminiimonas sp.]|nr:methyltransferase [Herminiimonas sp.]
MTIGFRIQTMPARLAASLIEAFAQQAVSHLSDSMGRTQTAAAAIRPMHGGATVLCGPALTVRVPPGDHLMVQKALDLAEPGDVIVVDAGGLVEVAMIGDIMTTYATQRGIAGFVIDGAIRDAAEIAGRNLPVYARGVSPRGPSRLGPGEIHAVVSVGGMVVHPGDIIVGDADGVVAVPRADVEEVLAAARALRVKEENTFRAIAEGRLDRAWIDEVLRARGCGSPL